MPRIHTFETPEPGTIEILELTGNEIQRIAEQAAKDHPLDIVSGSVIEAKLKRLACIRAYVRRDTSPAPEGVAKSPLVDIRVSSDVGAHDVLASMSARALAFLDRAIDHVHEVRPEELKPFLSTQTVTEV